VADKQKQRQGVLPRKENFVVGINWKWWNSGLIENSKHSMWIATCEKNEIFEKWGISKKWIYGKAYFFIMACLQINEEGRKCQGVMPLYFLPSLLFYGAP